MKLKLFIFALFILLSLVAYQKYSEYSALKSINSYESCAAAKGSTIQESYPATCITRLGAHFTESINQGNFSQNWLTYTNRIFGVRFQYPGNYENVGCAGIVDSNDCISLNDTFIAPDHPGRYDYQIEITTKPSNQSYASYLNINAKDLTRIGEKLAYINVAENAEDQNGKYITKQVGIEISPNAVIYFSGLYDSVESKKMFDQILSTFKFTN